MIQTLWPAVIETYHQLPVNPLLSATLSELVCGDQLRYQIVRVCFDPWEYVVWPVELACIQVVQVEYLNKRDKLE